MYANIPSEMIYASDMLARPHLSLHEMMHKKFAKNNMRKYSEFLVTRIYLANILRAEYFFFLLEF